MQLLALQRQVGNRAVANALTTSVQRAPRLPGIPIELQRVDCKYDAAERATAATSRGVLIPDVSLLAATGSGYNAAANSIVVADFEPGSAVVKGSTAGELRGSWIDILERHSSQRYAVLGFTDCVGDERANEKLRADRAHAVAAMLPKTARRASAIGAAPTVDFLMPANSTPSERALNRSVLLRLPFEELRQAEEVDEYSADAVQFWRSSPNGSVDDLINFVTQRAGALLDRNGVPNPKVVKGTIPQIGALGTFNSKSWTITLDEKKMTSGSGVTSGTKMSKLTVDAVANLSSTCYHEARHAEQAFMTARLTAEEAKGKMSARDLALKMDIPPAIADAALSASSTMLPDKLKAQASSWQTFAPGGRYFPYKTWNEQLHEDAKLVSSRLEWEKYEKLDPGQVQELWEKSLHRLVDKSFRRNFYWRADDLLRDMEADPHHDPVDDVTGRAFKNTISKLRMVLDADRAGKNLPGSGAIGKMDPVTVKIKNMEAQNWLTGLAIALLETQIAADEAYRAYPDEADAYQVEDAVKASIKRQGS
ncbi:MAG: hypothetical protein ACRDS0_03585 [Pseudonocardiaceae bacterium]